MTTTLPVWLRFENKICHSVPLAFLFYIAWVCESDGIRNMHDQTVYKVWRNSVRGFWRKMNKFCHIKKSWFLTISPCIGLFVHEFERCFILVLIRWDLPLQTAHNAKEVVREDIFFWERKSTRSRKWMWDLDKKKVKKVMRQRVNAHDQYQYQSRVSDGKSREGYS